MNTFHDLLERYAGRDGLTVDAREWLMLQELDPHTAARVMAHLTLLAAEDLTIDLTARARDALADASTRAAAGPDDHVTAMAGLWVFTDRIAAARRQATHIWETVLRPLLVAAGVLIPAPTAVVRRPPRAWSDGWVRLPGAGGAYPARIAVRRRQTGYPIVRLDLATCRQVAADIAAARTADPHRHGPAHQLRPVIVLDRDQPAVVIAADSLDHAWAAGATVLHPGSDGRYQVGARHWPWQLDTTPTRDEASPQARPSHPTQPATTRRHHRRRGPQASTAVG